MLHGTIEMLEMSSKSSASKIHRKHVSCDFVGEFVGVVLLSQILVTGMTSYGRNYAFREHVYIFNSNCENRIIHLIINNFSVM